MEIEHAGIIFDVNYKSGRGLWEDAEIEIAGWRVSDWDELAAWYGVKGVTPLVRPSLFKIVDAIIDQQYEILLDDAETSLDLHGPDPW